MQEGITRLAKRTPFWLAVAVLGAVAFLAACSSSGRIRVYIEPSYEQPQLQRVVSQFSDVFVLTEPETADIRLSIGPLPESREHPGERHAVIRAREIHSGREVFAVARLAPRKGEAIPWVNNYEPGVHEGSLPEILDEVIHAARAGRAPEGDTWAERLAHDPNIKLP